MANPNSIDLESTLSQYLSITDASQNGALDVTGDLTMEIWVNTESDPGTDVAYGLISKWDTGDQVAYNFYYINDAGTNKLTFGVDADCAPAGATFAQINYTITTATWTHLAVRYNASAGAAQFYVNGTAQGAEITGLATSIGNCTSAFNIGRVPRIGNGSAFDGLLDDARVWNTARTSTQISSNYNCELTGTETGLVGYWKMDNNSNDSTSNANNLTQNGTPVFSTSVPFTAACGAVTIVPQLLLMKVG